jgi:hypothetical protein
MAQAPRLRTSHDLGKTRHLFSFLRMLHHTAAKVREIPELLPANRWRE